MIPISRSAGVAWIVGKSERQKCRSLWRLGNFREAKIIALTTYKGDTYRFFGQSKQEPKVTCLKCASQGAHTNHPSASCRKRALPPKDSYEIAEHPTDDMLTPPEINVLRLIATECHQIADQFSITEETGKGQLKNILPKLAPRMPAAIIDWSLGIIELYFPSTRLTGLDPKTLKIFFRIANCFQVGRN
jgi:DNA-binding NarL/FixJ family response regulator